jgi:hypothetical protein
MGSGAKTSAWAWRTEGRRKRASQRMATRMMNLQKLCMGRLRDDYQHSFSQGRGREDRRAGNRAGKSDLRVKQIIDKQGKIPASVIFHNQL